MLCRVALVTPSVSKLINLILILFFLSFFTLPAFGKCSHEIPLYLLLLYIAIEVGVYFWSCEETVLVSFDGICLWFYRDDAVLMISSPFYLFFLCRDYGSLVGYNYVRFPFFLCGLLLVLFPMHA